MMPMPWTRKQEYLQAEPRLHMEEKGPMLWEVQRGAEDPISALYGARCQTVVQTTIRAYMMILKFISTNLTPLQQDTHLHSPPCLLGSAILWVQYMSHPTTSQALTVPS